MQLPGHYVWQNWVNDVRVGYIGKTGGEVTQPNPQAGHRIDHDKRTSRNLIGKGEPRKVKPAYFGFPLLGFFFVFLMRFFVGAGVMDNRGTGAGSSLRDSSSRSWSFVVGIGVVWPTESQP